MDKTWVVYMLRCADNSLYTGITTDINRRILEHNGNDNNGKKGAKYTRARRPVVLAYTETAINKSCACKREHQIKKLSKINKEQLVATYNLK